MKGPFATKDEAYAVAQPNEEVWARDSRLALDREGWCVMTKEEADEYARCMGRLCLSMQGGTTGRPFVSNDTFWTIGYKGHYIHGHYDRDLKREVIEVQWMKPDGSFELYKAKSLHGAKSMITRLITLKLQELEPAMKCGNRAEFQQRLAWLSEGTLKFHLSDGRMPYKQDQAEIDLYLSYKRNFV